jgi:hypothetical protein
MVEIGAITTGDLDRIAKRMRSGGHAYDLTTLARRLIHGRLLFGVDTETAALALTGDSQVRLWDPAASWNKGDRVIVARKINGRLTPFVGQVVDDKGRDAYIHIDGENKPAIYEKAPAGSQKALTWREAVIKAVEGLRDDKDIEAQIDAVLFEQGASIVSHLLDALQSNPKFIELKGRWFLRELLRPLSIKDVKHIYKALRQAGTPLSVDDLLPSLPPSDEPDDVRLFSLYEGLCTHPDWFNRIEDTDECLWTPRVPEWNEARVTHYVYDPDTYEILVESGKRLTRAMAERLEKLGFYSQVVEFDV